MQTADHEASLNFELDARDQPVTQRQLFATTAGGQLDQGRVIGLRVTDDSGYTAVARQEITILGSFSAPVARFTVAPSRVVAGRFRFAFRNGTPRLDGRLDATLGKPRPLPRRCSRLR